ncbi:MAG: hypothetical protein ACYS8W_01610 [Planctomycetota bacterium]|jgi:hypothetical protein
MTSTDTDPKSPPESRKRDVAFWFITAIKAFLLLCFAALYFVLPAVSAEMREGNASDESAFYNRMNADWFLISVFAVLPLIISVVAPFVRQFQRGPQYRFRPLIFWTALVANMIYLNWFIPPLPDSKARNWQTEQIRVQQIAFALAQYSEMHDGTLPLTLDELVDEGLLNLDKPVTSPPEAPGKAGKPYIYSPEITPDMPAACIILASRLPVFGDLNACWFIRNGFLTPVPWQNQDRGWIKTQQDVIRFVSAQQTALAVIKDGFDDPGRLERALSTLNNRLRPQLTRSMIAWALGAGKVKAARETLKDVLNSHTLSPSLKFECARALMRVGETSDIARPAEWIASVKLASLLPAPPNETAVPRIAAVVEKLNATAMDADTFAKETNLEKETADEYLRRLVGAMLLAREGANYRLGRKGLHLLSAGKEMLMESLEECRQKMAAEQLGSEPSYIERRQAIDALTERFPNRQGYEPFLDLASRRRAAKRWKELFGQ